MARKKPFKAYDTLSIRVPPEVGMEVDMWAERAGVKRSEMGRWVWMEALQKIRRNGRHWLAKRVKQSQNDARAAKRGLSIIRPRKGGQRAGEQSGTEDAHQVTENASEKGRVEQDSSDHRHADEDRG